MLGWVVAANQAAREPPGTWCLAHSRRRAPPPEAPPLAHRGYSQTEYAAALELLAVRGWLARGEQGNYTVTPEGQAVRASVEPKQRLVLRVTAGIAYNQLGRISRQGLLAPRLSRAQHSKADRPTNVVSTRVEFRSRE